MNPKLDRLHISAPSPYIDCYKLMCLQNNDYIRLHFQDYWVIIDYEYTTRRLQKTPITIDYIYVLVLSRVFVLIAINTTAV